MENKKQNKQKQLERIIAIADPQRLYSGVEDEYKDEVRMFLSRVNDSMSEDELLNVMHRVFREMFNVSDDVSTREIFRPIIGDYLKIKDER